MQLLHYYFTVLLKCSGKLVEEQRKHWWLNSAWCNDLDDLVTVWLIHVNTIVSAGPPDSFLGTCRRVERGLKVHTDILYTLEIILSLGLVLTLHRPQYHDAL